MTVSTEQTSADNLSTEQRLMLEHRLGIRRILVDRLLIGVLLALVGFLASLMIEQFKVTSSETRYFLEKRLDAATKARSALTVVAGEAIDQTIAPCTSTVDARPPIEKLRRAIDQIIVQLNDAALLFTKEYLLDANRVVNVFLGAAEDQSAITCESRYFFSEVSDYLTHRTKTEVHGGTETWNGYQPLELGKKDIDEIGTAKYFKRNLAAWSTARGQTSE